MLYRLTYIGKEYYPDSCSGPGFGWRTRTEDYTSLSDLREALKDMQEQIAEAKHQWDQWEPKGRSAFNPPYRDLRIQEAVLRPCESEQRILDNSKKWFDAAYAKHERYCMAKENQWEQEERKKLRQLQEKYPDA